MITKSILTITSLLLYIWFKNADNGLEALLAAFIFITVIVPIGCTYCMNSITRDLTTGGKGDKGKSNKRKYYKNKKDEVPRMTLEEYLNSDIHKFYMDHANKIAESSSALATYNNINTEGSKKSSTRNLKLIDSIDKSKTGSNEGNKGKFAVRSYVANSPVSYDTLRTIIINLNREKRITDDNITILRNQINNLISSKTKQYDNYTFNSMLHEVYVKIKYKDLTNEEIKCLINLVCDMTEPRKN